MIFPIVGAGQAARPACLRGLKSYEPPLADGVKNLPTHLLRTLEKAPGHRRQGIFRPPKGVIRLVNLGQYPQPREEKSVPVQLHHEVHFGIGGEVMADRKPAFWRGHKTS